MIRVYFAALICAVIFCFVLSAGMSQALNVMRALRK